MFHCLEGEAESSDGGPMAPPPTPMREEKLSIGPALMVFHEQAQQKSWRWGPADLEDSPAEHLYTQLRFQTFHELNAPLLGALGKQAPFHFSNDTYWLGTGESRIKILSVCTVNFGRTCCRSLAVDIQSPLLLLFLWRARTFSLGVICIPSSNYTCIIQG